MWISFARRAGETVGWCPVFASFARSVMPRRYRKMPSIGLYCVELRTSRWEASLRWFREILGLRVLVRVPEDGYALLEAGETRLVLLAREGDVEPSPRWSLGFEVDSLEAIILRLKAEGCKIL